MVAPLKKCYEPEASASLQLTELSKMNDKLDSIWPYSGHRIGAPQRNLIKSSLCAHCNSHRLHLVLCTSAKASYDVSRLFGIVIESITQPLHCRGPEARPVPGDTKGDEKRSCSVWSCWNDLDGAQNLGQCTTYCRTVLDELLEE